MSRHKLILQYLFFKNEIVFNHFLGVVALIVAMIIGFNVSFTPIDVYRSAFFFLGPCFV